MRNNQLLLLFLILIVQQLSAQETEKLTHFGVGLTPQLGIIVQKHEGLYESHPEFSITIDAKLIRKISDRVELHTGLGLQKAALSQRDYSPLFPSDHDGMGGADRKKSYYEVPLEYFAVGIPVSLRINLSDRPSGVYISGGLHLMQVLHTNEEFLLVESGLQTHELDFEDLGIEMQKTQFFATAGVGHHFAMENGKALSIGLQVSYSLLNIFSGTSPFNISSVGGHSMFFGLRLMYQI